MEESSVSKTISDEEAEKVIRDSRIEKVTNNDILTLNNDSLTLNNYMLIPIDKDNILNHPYIKSLMLNRTEDELYQLINNTLMKAETETLTTLGESPSRNVVVDEFAGMYKMLYALRPWRHRWAVAEEEEESVV